ncbi:unnamed protein product, partial [Fusarium graminearum]
YFGDSQHKITRVRGTKENTLRHSDWGLFTKLSLGITRTWQVQSGRRQYRRMFYDGTIQSGGADRHSTNRLVLWEVLHYHIHSCRRIPTSLLELQMGKHWILFLLLLQTFLLYGTTGSCMALTWGHRCKEKLHHVHNTGMAVEDWANQISLNTVCLIRGNAFFVSCQP